MAKLILSKNPNINCQDQVINLNFIQERMNLLNDRLLPRPRKNS